MTFFISRENQASETSYDLSTNFAHFLLILMCKQYLVNQMIVFKAILHFAYFMMIVVTAGTARTQLS